MDLNFTTFADECTSLKLLFALVLYLKVTRMGHERKNLRISEAQWLLYVPPAFVYLLIRG
jgi:hypothetical protein